MTRHPLPASEYAAAARTLLRTRAAVESQPVEVSWLHGDCKTDNILVAQDATYGIDLSLRHENSVEHDLAQFLNHLDLLLMTPRYWHAAAMHPGIGVAFRTGYRSTGLAVSEPCLRWVRLWALLELWRSTLGASSGSRPRDWILGRMFARLCTKLTVEVNSLSRVEEGGSVGQGD